MPHVNLWIRNIDWDKWNAIEDKPAWLHLALNGTDVPVINKAIKERVEIEKVLDNIPIIPLPTPVRKLCKIHGLPLDDRDRCLQKGCKYA